MQRAINREQKRGVSTSFGVTIKERTFAAQNTRYQFNGKEYDTETETSDFGARNLDGDLGVWETVDPQFSRQPGWSTYKAFLDNPIIYQDPDGETEFYNKRGKHIGSDGNPNNLLAKVHTKELTKSIKQATKKGMAFKDLGNLENGSSFSGGFAIDSDVLRASRDLLNMALDKGKMSEFGLVMAKDENGKFQSSEINEGPIFTEGNDATVKLPNKDGATISIHSHITTKGTSENTVSNSEASTKYNTVGETSDSDVFPNYEMNITVGRKGKSQDGSYDKTPNINIYGSGTDKPIGGMTKKIADKILKSTPK